MKLEYTSDGKFVPETEKLVDQLGADAVLLVVFGSTKKGSGCCCEMRVDEPERFGWKMIATLREIADAFERDLMAGKVPQ